MTEVKLLESGKYSIHNICTRIISNEPIETFIPRKNLLLAILTFLGGQVQNSYFLGPVHMEWATSLRWDVSQLSFI